MDSKAAKIPSWKANVDVIGTLHINIDTSDNVIAPTEYEAQELIIARAKQAFLNQAHIDVLIRELEEIK
jgi:hypothetical protein